MLSKCANPECSEKFLFLHSGELFHLMPTPEIRAAAGKVAALRERLWLCDRCSKVMTIVWSRTKAELMPLAAKPRRREEAIPEAGGGPSVRKQAARAGAKAG